MDLRIAPSFLFDLVQLEAEARGLARRLSELAAERALLDMDDLDARVDAAHSLGLVNALSDRLLETAAVLESGGVEVVELDDAHAGMPTLRRLDEATVQFTHDAAPLGTLAASFAKLAEALAADPERTVVSLAVGLGGTGGCATGECLPEDAPAGPLFERPVR
ncbi:MAG: hypothetical protein RL199_697 [Pseudomonadota bacterium]|jgi:hypothetical protein